METIPFETHVAIPPFIDKEMWARIGPVEIYAAAALGTSLLRRLQVQTLTDETPPIGKIHPFSKMAVTFEQMMRF